jgi:Epoxide hydrolase N terminus
MRTFVRPTDYVTFRDSIVVALVALGILLMSSDRAEPNTAIRPFRIDVPEAELAELRQRVLATRWPDKETVADQSQGIQLARLQELVRYWGTAYDWRKVESQLNSLPQFMTTIDGVDIHFIQVRSRHRNALPVIITHGWPGSIIEQLKIIGPLTDPPRTEAAPRTPSTW